MSRDVFLRLQDIRQAIAATYRLTGGLDKAALEADGRVHGESLRYWLRQAVVPVTGTVPSPRLRGRGDFRVASWLLLALLFRDGRDPVPGA